MNLLELLIKGAGHKYIKRIPVGTTKTGKVRYRYIYRADHTVGGKHLLDEAHLKAGTKLMLHSKDGAEVHAHIDSVKGDQVTFTYDDGDRKGETRTVSKQKLLAEFNKENKVEDKITSAKAGLLSDIKAAADRGTSKKQLARLVARLERLGGEDKPEQEKPKENKPSIELDKDDIKRLNTIHGEEVADTRIEDINNMAAEGVTPKSLLADLRKPPEVNSKGNTIYTLSDGTRLAIGKGRAGISFPGSKSADAEYDIPSELVGKEPKIAKALAYMSYAGRDEDGDRLTYDELSAGDEKRLSRLAAVAKSVESLQALKSFTAIDQKVDGQVIQAATETSVTEYKKLPAAARNMLQAATGGTTRNAAAITLTNHIDLPYLEAGEPTRVTATDGSMLVTTLLNSSLEDRTAFKANGEVAKYKLDIAPPSKYVIKAAESDVIPAINLPADTARKISAVLKAAGANKKNTEHRVIIDSYSDTTGDKVSISYLGKILATFPKQAGDTVGKTAVNGKYLSTALMGGASTIHLSNSESGSIMVTSANTKALIMPIRL